MSLSPIHLPYLPNLFYLVWIINHQQLDYVWLIHRLNYPFTVKGNKNLIYGNKTQKLLLE